LGYIISPSDKIINVDAHKDDEDYEMNCCGSWANGLSLYTHIDRPIKAHKILKEKNLAGDFFPDIIYMCLSSPWTPKKTDKHFFEFVQFMSRKCIDNEPIFFGHRKDSLKKRYQKYVDN
jgi:hypothetical protein